MPPGARVVRSERRVPCGVRIITSRRIAASHQTAGSNAGIAIHQSLPGVAPTEPAILSGQIATVDGIIESLVAHQCGLGG